MQPNNNRPPGKRGGQALVETAITLVLFFTIILGVITFGHAIMTWNMIRHAAREGAHVAATWPTRTAGGSLTNTAGIVIMADQALASRSGGSIPVHFLKQDTNGTHGSYLTCGSLRT